jgi:TetR/AcrR family transcriptional regulator, transcriptional repressor of aconitase
MPRVTAKHEQEVRDRILVAAANVFGTIGYRRSTIADIVKASGLSVGAIYTYFAGKDELFFAVCQYIAERDLTELAQRMPAGMDPALKISTAVAIYIDQIDPTHDPKLQGTETGYAVQAWAEVGQSSTVAATLRGRRANLEGIAKALIDEAIEAGIAPAWVDREGLAAGFVAMLDGLMLDRVEMGAEWSRERALRSAYAVIGPVLAAAVAEPPQLAPPPAPGPLMPDVRL